jgi:hypothetical protein
MLTERQPLVHSSKLMHLFAIGAQAQKFKIQLSAKMQSSAFKTRVARVFLASSKIAQQFYPNQKSSTPKVNMANKTIKVQRSKQQFRIGHSKEENRG